MLNTLIIIAAFILLAVLLYSEKRSPGKLVLAAKTPLSALFILTA
ncbi:MAG: lysoplasmalogenase, partial [Deltaproteobacteria bacterium]|nr:lysoplasmalogenase [Deltaproteobacteria bacterium]